MILAWAFMRHGLITLAKVRTFSAGICDRKTIPALDPWGSDSLADSLQGAEKAHSVTGLAAAIAWASYIGQATCKPL